MKNKSSRLFWIFVGIVNVVAIFGLVLYVAVIVPSFSMAWYRMQFRINNSYEALQMEAEDLHAVTRHMIRYMQGREDSLQISTIVNGQERYFFSELEIRHMEDVRVLYHIAFIGAMISLSLLIVTTLSFIIWGRKRLKTWLRCLQGVFGAIIFLLLVLGALIAINWHFAFDVFHEILFNNDYWQLNPRSDLMLSMMPYEFFINTSIFIGAVIGSSLILGFATSTVFLVKGKKRTKKELH